MSVRSFRTSDSPERAAEIVRRMTVEDGGALPPFVEARRTAPGAFSATGLLGTRVEARMSVRSDGRGGSIVSEEWWANSPMPGMATFAEIVHGVAIDPADAYERVRRRR